MVHYLISCRSLTWAQRMGRTLERAGITAGIIRAPHDRIPEGCGYCLRISEKNLSRALLTLNAAGYDKSRIIVYRDGEAENHDLPG